MKTRSVTYSMAAAVFAFSLFLTTSAQTKADFSSMDEWRELDVAQWEPQRAAELMGLFGPLFAGYAEFRAPPNMSIEITEAPGETYEVMITQEGFADDSVAGERWAAKVKHGVDGWYIEALWWQQTCYRGVFAGMWTKERCL